MKKLTPLIILGIFAVTITIVIVTTFMLKHKEVPEGEFKNMVGATYVGSMECKKCHERKYLEWATTLHSKMMQDAKANPLVIKGDFDIPSKIRTFKKEDVHYILGNRWREMYLKKVGDDYEVLPAIYEIFSNKWVAIKGPSPRSWFKECAGCHATGVDPVKKTFKEPGIGCEACHGPGSNHVKAIPGYEIPTTINPQRMTSGSAVQICGSCHSRGKDKKTGHPYPVEYMTARGLSNLYVHFRMANPKDNPELFWPSGEGKYGYMEYVDWKESAHARAGITCTDCHIVHLGLEPMQVRRPGDMLCRDCHTATENKMAHRIHTFGSCIDCHMPKTGIGEAGGGAIARSHTFRFISPELSMKMGGVKNQPNSCSGCHHHKDTPLEDLIEFLDAAKKEGMPLPFSAHRRPPRRE